MKLSCIKELKSIFAMSLDLIISKKNNNNETKKY